MMAGISNQSKCNSRNIVHNIIFDGALLSSTRAVLVTELLHYFLYERQQIPLPIDQLRFRTSAWASSAESGTSDHYSSPSSSPTRCSQIKCSSQENVKRISSNRKAVSLLGDLKNVSDNLRKAFETCAEVEQVAILLGGTSMNPKESILINFPPPCPDADCLPVDACKRTLFKQIISEDLLGSLPTNVSPSNISVLVSAPRSLPLVWFLPKHSMKTPKSGSIISLNFHCTYLEPICHNLTIVDGDGNISGLEALDCTQCENECFNLDDCLENESVMNSSNGQHSSSNGINEDSSNRVISQFCQHQKLNYIFNSYEKKFKKMISSPVGKTLSAKFLKSCAVTEDVCVNDIYINNSCDSKHQFEGQFSCQNPVFSGNKDSDMSAKQEAVDCIWYQSPLILKGFRE